MEELGLAGRTPRRKRYSSYHGEIGEAPPNLLRGEDGRHRFSADAPNKVWVSDITEFAIPAGKVYLSPVLDCFDGMPIGWSASTSPNAELANSSLRKACGWLRGETGTIIHTDRGVHYRWPEWIAVCEGHGLVRSMSRKGCSADNARCEGFFGRLKTEFFDGRDWSGVSVEEFIEELDGYMKWYRDERIKSDLGNRSPMQYRRDLGLLG
jgi:transposase InsO family protein